jgi:oligopeptidase B
MTLPIPPLEPPQARRIPHENVFHGDRLVDDYFWMRDKSDPEVIAYLEAENHYAREAAKPIEGLANALYDELLDRIRQTDLSVPHRRSGYLYYHRTEEGLQYAIHCRRKSEDAAEEVVLDLNELGRDHAFVALGCYEPSDDGTALAYSIDTVGFRQYTLRVKNLVTGEHGPEAIPCAANVTWAADGRTLFYTVEDSAKRHYRLYRHRLGEAADELIYEEEDERFHVGCTRTRSRRYLLLTADSATTSEVRFLAADRPEEEWRVIAPRIQGQEYAVDHHGDRFFVRVNDTGRNFRLVAAPVDHPGRESWVEEIPHRPAVMLTGMDFFAAWRVLWERDHGIPHVAVTELASGATHRIAFPEDDYEVTPGMNAEFEATRLRYQYTSFVTPLSVFDYDMAQRSAVLRKRTDVLGDFDPSRYATERIAASDPDGVSIPISLVYRRGVVRDGRSPLLLYGYGAYGHPLFATFNSNRLSLLDRGFVYAIAHARGGGEMGKAWHDGGRMMQKRNTFTDFIACAEHLVAQGFTSPDRLCIQGGSAGGLLMGAVLNLRPDLFRAALVMVPFVDVLQTMSDASLPLTVGEFEEWGNPALPDEYRYLKSYCPYTNLAPRAYPAMLVRTSLHDSQVMYWEPAKYVARLRRIKTDSNPLLFRINMAGGHGGSSGRYDALRDVAFDYAFLLACVGLAESEPPRNEETARTAAAAHDTPAGAGERPS